MTSGVRMGSLSFHVSVAILLWICEFAHVLLEVLGVYAINRSA